MIFCIFFKIQISILPFWYPFHPFSYYFHLLQILTYIPPKGFFHIIKSEKGTRFPQILAILRPKIAILAKNTDCGGYWCLKSQINSTFWKKGTMHDLYFINQKVTTKNFFSATTTLYPLFLPFFRIYIIYMIHALFHTLY